MSNKTLPLINLFILSTNIAEYLLCCRYNSQSSSSLMFYPLQPHGHMPGFPVHHQLPELAQTWVYWDGDAFVVPFSCLQSCPASRSFPMSQFFALGGQSIGASASVLPMDIQDWIPLGLNGLIALLSKQLSRVFSNTTFEKHQFFTCQLSLWSNTHIHTWLLEKP